MERKFLILLNLILVIPSFIFNQNITTNKNNIANDCLKAIELKFKENKIFYDHIQKLAGAGEIEEFSSKIGNLYFFEKEHNTVWYTFTTPIDGELALKIIPKNFEDDYDFLLFKVQEKSNFCEDIQKKKILPIRTNMARTGIKGKPAITGLSHIGEKEFVKAGPGNEFSKTYPAKKGERFYLVVDNVYGNEGHKIEIGFEIEYQFKGEVKGENGQTLKSEVSLVDKYGVEIKKVMTDSTGKFFIPAYVWTGDVYTFSFYADSFFVGIEEVEINTTQKYEINDIRMVLPKLKKGEKYKFYSINFYPNSWAVLPESYASLEALYKLMKKNKDLEIRIEGHVNPDKRYPGGFELSYQRAETVKKYLVNKGIEKERISTTGFGDKYPIFYPAKNEEEMKKNRRVEINILKYLENK